MKRLMHSLRHTAAGADWWPAQPRVRRRAGLFGASRVTREAPILPSVRRRRRFPDHAVSIIRSNHSDHFFSKVSGSRASWSHGTVSPGCLDEGSPTGAVAPGCGACAFGGRRADCGDRRAVATAPGPGRRHRPEGRRRPGDGRGHDPRAVRGADVARWRELRARRPALPVDGPHHPAGASTDAARAGPDRRGDPVMEEAFAVVLGLGAVAVSPFVPGLRRSLGRSSPAVWPPPTRCRAPPPSPANTGRTWSPRPAPSAPARPPGTPPPTDAETITITKP